MIKKLLYLTFTRLDISYAVQILSQFMDKPTEKHLIAAHRVLKYMKASLGQRVLMKPNSNLRISTYYDSD